MRDWFDILNRSEMTYRVLALVLVVSRSKTDAVSTYKLQLYSVWRYRLVQLVNA